MSARSGRWDLLGYPSDPVPADEIDVQRVASDYARKADEVDSVRSMLVRTGSGRWVGRAASQFEIGKSRVASDLVHTQGEYEHAATSLRSYASAVGDARARTGQALHRAVAAEAERATYASVQLPRQPMYPFAATQEQMTRYWRENAAWQTRKNDLETHRHHAQAELTAASLEAHIATEELDKAARRLGEELNGGWLLHKLQWFGLVPDFSALGLAKWLANGLFGVMDPLFKRYAMLRRKAFAGGKGLWGKTKNKFLNTVQDKRWRAKPNMKGGFHQLGRLGRATGRFAGVAGAAITAYEQWNEDSKNPHMGNAEKVARTGTVVASAASGAAAGALIGSLVPGPGTVVGAFVGGAIGGALGTSAGKHLANGVSKIGRKLKFW